MKRIQWVKKPWNVADNALRYPNGGVWQAKDVVDAAVGAREYFREHKGTRWIAIQVNGTFYHFEAAEHMNINLHTRYYWSNCQRAVVLTGEELRRMVPNYQPYPRPAKSPPLIQQIYFTNFSAFSVN